MLKLKKLTFKNVGRFVEEQTIDFSNLNSLIQVDAQNNNTGGSSGSGKSTIFNALDWLLGLSDLSTGVLQSRLTKETLSVTGYFDWNNKEVVINRSKKLSIIVDGVETKGSSKISEELLDQIIGMERTLFRPLLHKRQGEQGFFLNLGPSKINNFLVDALGHSLIRNKVEIIEEKAKEIIQENFLLESELKTLESSLKATEDALHSLNIPPTTNVTEDLLEAYKAELESVKTSLLSKELEHKKTIDALELKRPRLSITPFDNSVLIEIEKNIKILESEFNKITNEEKERQLKINKEINNLKLNSNNSINELKVEFNNKLNELNNQKIKLNSLIKEGEIAKEKAIKVAGHVKTIRNGLCSVCEQSWVTDKAKEEERRLLEELQNYKNSIQNASDALINLNNLEGTISEINLQYNAQVNSFNELTKIKLIQLTEQAKPLNLSELKEIEQKIQTLQELKFFENKKQEEHNQKQNKENQKLLEDFLVIQRNIVKEHQDELTIIRKKLEEKQNIYNQASNSFYAWQSLFDNYTKNSNFLNSKINDMNSKLVDMNSKLVHLNEKIEIAQETKRCLKSYLSCSFDDALDSISDCATQILRAVPTMANATIRLEGTKETANGTIQEQVNAVLDNDGELSVPIKSLSGGERSAVDLSIDLAVCQMIQEKANTGIDLICLDEPFNGFDSTGIEHALEILKTFASDKKILIVEHDSVAKEFVQNKITVVRDGETSYLK